MKNRRIALVIIIILVGVIGITYGPEIIPELAYARSDAIANTVNPALVDSNTEFALDLFSVLCEEDPDENIFISPFSISTALSMAYSGAESGTEEAMAEAIKVQDLSRDDLEKGFETLLNSLNNADEGLTLNIANSVWIRDSYEHLVHSEYKEKLVTSYQSELFAEPFDQTTVDAIND